MSTVEKTYIFVRKEGGGEEHVYEEDGWAPSIVADELSPYTNYRVEPGAVVDGLQATAENRVSFQTLRRNNLTATFNAARRQGLNTPLEGGWQVYYDYTSLYAISSCILYVSQNGTQVGQYQGVADYNTSQMTFGIPASDWICCGEQYDLHVTVIDIFGQSYTTPVTTITTDTLNLVSMEYASSTTSSVTFDLDYWLDSGFVSGYLEYWDEGDDPSTVQPQSHFYFYDGDAQVTADGLDEGTTYIFRVTIVLNDGQRTEIHTSYQNASTAGTNWKNVPMFVENTGTSDMVVGVYKQVTTPSFVPSLYSSSNGSDWTAYTPSDDVVIRNGEKVYFKGDNSNGFNGEWSVLCSPVAGQSTIGAACSVGGNVMSLVSSSGYTSLSAIPSKAFGGLFKPSATSYVTDASRLNFGSASDVGTSGCNSMFTNCTRLVTPPDTSSFKTVREFGLGAMLNGCSALRSAPSLSGVIAVYGNGMGDMLRATSIVSPPDLSGVSELYGDAQFRAMLAECRSLVSPVEFTSLRSANTQAFIYMYMGCDSLRSGSDIRAITVVGAQGMYGMYDSCTNLATVYYPNITRYDRSQQWLNGCAATGTIYVPTEAVHDAIVNTSVVPSGWRVVVQS